MLILGHGFRVQGFIGLYGVEGSKGARSGDHCKRRTLQTYPDCVCIYIYISIHIYIYTHL